MLRVTGLCEGKPPVTGEFLSQRDSDVEMFRFDDVIMMYWASVAGYSLKRRLYFIEINMQH